LLGEIRIGMSDEFSGKVVRARLALMGADL